jgi:hypothetical protein
MQFTIIPPDGRSKFVFPLKQWWGDLSTGAIYTTFPYESTALPCKNAGI